jgi:hypothetical protein
MMSKIIAIIIVLVLVYLSIKPKRSVYKGVKSYQFSRFINKLLNQMKGNGSIFIENEEEKKCIVITRFIDEERIMVNVVLPIAAWSLQYVKIFQDILKSEDIKYTSMDAVGEAKSFLKGYVVVPNLPDIERVVEVAKLAVKVIDLQADASFTLRFVSNEQAN